MVRVIHTRGTTTNGDEQEQLGACERGEAACGHRADQQEAGPVPSPVHQQQYDGDEQDRQRLGLQHAVMRPDAWIEPASDEVLASLYFDAGHIDAVELNPVTYRFVTQKFADYDGHFTDNPRSTM